jgi:cytochrome b561
MLHELHWKFPRTSAMPVMNQSARYDSVSQFLHWTTALMVVVLLIIGKAGLFDADHPGSAGFMWHGSLGVLVLVLVAARLLWRLVSPSPSFPQTMTRLGRIAARTMHASLYVLLVALSLSGWLAASSEGSSVNFFNVATLPRWELSGPAQARPDGVSPTAAPRAQAPPSAGAGEDREGPAKEVHELLADALLILVALHFLAALKHQFIDRDGLIRRMLPAGGSKSIPTAGHT